MAELIDIERCNRAKNDIQVSGCPDRGVVSFSDGYCRGRGPADPRLEVLEDAMAAILEDGATALKGTYLGIKNYAGFGDQRNDGPVGTSPRHGSIVFSVKRRGRTSETVLGADHVYYLECVRDFGSREDGQKNYQEKRVGLDAILRERERLLERLEVLDGWLAGATVESHA